MVGSSFSKGSREPCGVQPAAHYVRRGRPVQDGDPTRGGLTTCGPPLGAGEGGARVDCDGRGNESLDHEQRGAWGGSRDMEILQPPPPTSTEAYES